MEQNSDILVIGSSGFIGSHLTQLLSARGFRVVGFDTQEPASAFGIDRFIQGDIRNADDVAAGLEGVGGVINLAAVHADYGHAPEEYFDTNETGMSVLLNAMAQANVKRMVFSSSIAVYGERNDEACEKTRPSPTTPYGKSKLAAEQRIEQWIAEDPTRCVTVIRPCVVYGERNLSNMLNLIRQVYSGFFVLFGPGTNVKATAYVGNLVQAISQHYDQLSPGIKTYNYADKPDLTVGEIVSIIRRELGRSPRAMRFPLWLGIIAATPFDIVSKITGKNLPISRARVKKLAQSTKINAQKIRNDGFEQLFRSDDGIGRMVRHFLSPQGSSTSQAESPLSSFDRHEPAQN